MAAAPPLVHKIDELVAYHCALLQRTSSPDDGMESQ